MTASPASVATAGCNIHARLTLMAEQTAAYQVGSGTPVLAVDI